MNLRALLERLPRQSVPEKKQKKRSEIPPIVYHAAQANRYGLPRYLLMACN